MLFSGELNREHSGRLQVHLKHIGTSCREYTESSIVGLNQLMFHEAGSKQKSSDMYANYKKTHTSKLHYH